MKKIISILLTLAMLISVCSNVVLAADTQATVGKQTPAYNPANRLIYMDESMVSGFNYSVAEFGGTDGGTYDYRIAPIAWPIQEKTGEDKVIAVENMATIDTSANTLTSKLSGVTYNLPAKVTHDTSVAGVTLSGKEALVIERGCSYDVSSSEAIRNYEYDIAANEKFDKIHILVATSSSTSTQQASGGGNKTAADTSADYNSIGWTRAGAISAIPVYSDGTSGLSNLTEGTEWKVNGQKETVFKREFIDSRDDDAEQDGLLVKAFPSNSQITDEDRNGFLTELKMYKSFTSTSNTIYGVATDGGFEIATDRSMNVYEYCIDIDEDKELDKIQLINQYSKSKRGFIVLGIVGEGAGVSTTPYFKDLEENNTAKIYVDPTDPDETTNVTYNKKNFLGRGTAVSNDGSNHFVALKWPLKAPANLVNAAKDPKGTITTKVVDGATDTTKDDISVVTSNLSGMTYELTRDVTVGDGAKDAVLLCPRRGGDIYGKGDSYALSATATIPVNNAPYNEISVLLAAAIQHGQNATNAPDRIRVYANYTDETKSIPDVVEGNVYNGDDGYVSAPMLYDRYDYNSMGGSKADCYLTEVEVMQYAQAGDNNMSANLPTTFTATFEESERVKVADYTYQRPNGIGYLFEYTLTLDPAKTVESITVETYFNENSTATDQYFNPVRGCAVLGVAGQQAVIGNPVDVAEGEVAIEAYTEEEGEVYAAVYDKTSKKLVAMEKATAVPSGITNIKVENDAIADNGQYDIKLFIWANKTFQPLTGAANVAIK